MNRAPLSKPPRSLVLKVAAAANVDPRSAEGALVNGASSIRGLAGERIAAVLPSFEEARALLEARVALDDERSRARVAVALLKHGRARTALVLHTNPSVLADYAAGKPVFGGTLVNIIGNLSALAALDDEVADAAL